MIVIRWAAIFVFLICMAVAADGVRDWLLAGVALVAFLVALWTLRGSSSPRPVSRHFDEQPSRLDRLERDGLAQFRADEQEGRR